MSIVQSNSHLLPAYYPLFYPTLPSSYDFRKSACRRSFSHSLTSTYINRNTGIVETVDVFNGLPVAHCCPKNIIYDAVLHFVQNSFSLCDMARNEHIIYHHEVFRFSNTILRVI